jgi:hypothetical protein
VPRLRRQAALLHPPLSLVTLVRTSSPAYCITMPLDWPMLLGRGLRRGAAARAAQRPGPGAQLGRAPRLQHGQVIEDGRGTRKATAPPTQGAREQGPVRPPGGRVDIGKRRASGVVGLTRVGALPPSRHPVVLCMDADLQHEPEAVPSVAGPVLAGEADFTVG